MLLSKRLTAIASFVPPGGRVADVGTDHGYIPLYLVKNGIVPSAIAMDVRSGPLSRAEEHVREQGLADRIELRLSDGLDALRAGEADTVVISGLGGPLMTEILTRGSRTAGAVKSFVLSPQSDIPGVRVFLRENGYRIAREALVRDEGKYYTVMLAEHGTDAPGRYIDDLYGRDLIDRRDPVLIEYLRREEERLQGLLISLSGSSKPQACLRSGQVREELSYTRQALQIMEEKKPTWNAERY